MIFVCSVVLADRAFSLHLSGKLLPLSEGDVLLIDDSDRDDFLPHAAYITEDRVDEPVSGVLRWHVQCGYVCLTGISQGVICAFGAFGFTPHRMLELQEHRQHEK